MVENIQASIRSWWGCVKHEPIDEIKTRFEKKYLALYEELQQKNSEANERGQRLWEQRVKEDQEGFRKARKRYEEKLEEQKEEREILKEIESIYRDFDNRCKDMLKNFDDWILDPRCHNAEYLRGYYACHMELVHAFKARKIKKETRKETRKLPRGW